ncbi:MULTISPECIES: CHASE3 domain-containing protein [Trichocoleus]|uniref:CHASE3 domain-containing protein n=1 Tax=Trichocoleus desertorum GB2-A4 TaxID=2933944 RepID=A0ABV0JBC5_9CYAN|nr:CHASE3 domain-containing protein [Trichocoleus sp. FACHB-46]
MLHNNMKLSRVVPIGFGTIFALMIGVGLASKLSMQVLANSMASVNRTYQIKGSLQELEKSLINAETGQRGFIFTGKEEFLEPYNAATTSLPTDISQLRSKLSNEEQKRSLVEVERLTQQKLDELAQTIALKRQGKEQELRALVLSGLGKTVMDNIRRELNKMQSVEDDLLVQRRAAATQAEQLASLISLGGTLVAIILGSSVAIFIARRVVQPINQVATAIASSASEIAAAVEQQEHTATQQAAAVSETTTTMDELSASSRQSAQQAEAAANSAQQALILVDGNGLGGRQGGEHNSSLRDKVGQIAEQILRLSEQTNQIGSISSLVSDLANQTNMLALNAAVEAARAGEHGRGFAVVAAEIRKLADQSRKSAERISSLVSDVQNATNSTVMVADEGTKTVEGIVTAMNNITVNNQQISLTAKQQAIAIEQVVDAMISLNQRALETASGISQTKASTQKLNEAAYDLKVVV